MFKSSKGFKGFKSFKGYFLLPVMPLRMALPILRSRPCLVVGIPTARATLVFKPEIPTARLSEKLSPGILAIIVSFDY